MRCLIPEGLIFRMDKMAASIDKGLTLIKLIMEKMEISNEEEYDDPDIPIDMSSQSDYTTNQ